MKTLKLIAVLFSIATANGIIAQETGIIKGTLTDEQNKNMPFVTVALMEDSTILEGVNTDDNGDFTFKHLTPGIYKLQFSSVGYKTKRINKIEVSANQTSYIYKTI